MELNVEVEKNKKKQIIISVIFVTIFLVIISLIFYAFKPKPSCFDKKLNQNEEGIDCGGVCAKKCEVVAKENIQVEKSGFVESGVENSYDLYAQVYNPNEFFGSNEFKYDFVMKNSAGQQISLKSGTAFILPGEKKYIIENNIISKEALGQIDLIISDAKWIEFTANYYQKPDIKVINKSYDEITGGVGFSEAKGLLKNDSQFDFTTIKVQIILTDSAGAILALNSTVMNTVKSGENRDFRAFWPNKFPGNVGNMEVEAEVNVYSSESFVKKYFKTETFQQYQ